MVGRLRFAGYPAGGVLLFAAFAVHAILCIMPSDAAAQVSNGTLVGNVKDESGAAVPGATITATETRTNIARTAISNETGNYRFNNLSPGIYRVDAELVGFTKFGREGVEVRQRPFLRDRCSDQDRCQYKSSHDVIVLYAVAMISVAPALSDGA